MRKLIKNISRILFLILLVFSLFRMLNVTAEELIFKITNIEVKEKSERVIVNDVSLTDGSIKNDILFDAKNDYITYNITIKNNSSDKYKIKSISDNNTSEYLKYSYDNLTGTVVEPGNETTFNMTITYVQESNDLTISDKAVTLTLLYEKEDGTTTTETITNQDNISSSNSNQANNANNKVLNNPKTGDNIAFYIILSVVSFFGLLITSVSKKYLYKSLNIAAIVSLVLIPLRVKAANNKFQIQFSTNKVQKGYTELISGKDFNVKVYKLASGFDDLEMSCIPGDGVEYCAIKHNNNFYLDSNVTSVKRATLSEYNNIKNELSDENIISNSNSNVPTYMWYDSNSGIIYYYSNSSKITLNPDSSYMFNSLTSATSIDVSSFDTSKVTNMNAIFSNCSVLEKLDLSNFDTRNVVIMQEMFSYCTLLTQLNISSFDTSNATNMAGMFSDCINLQSLDLSNFNTSKVTTMQSMFYSLSVNELDVTGFDTSNVTDMSHMFNSCSNLKSLDLSNFNTSKVTNMDNMFYSTKSLETLDLSNFDMSSNPTMIGMFNRSNAHVIW